MKAKVCFIGLGVMGFPMAGHLADAGYEVTVFNRTTEKSQLWLKKYSGKAATTPAEAAKDCDFVMLCVGNDNDVLSVVKVNREYFFSHNWDFSVVRLKTVTS